MVTKIERKNGLKNRKTKKRSKTELFYKWKRAKEKLKSKNPYRNH